MGVAWVTAHSGPKKLPWGHISFTRVTRGAPGAITFTSAKPFPQCEWLTRVKLLDPDANLLTRMHTRAPGPPRPPPARTLVLALLVAALVLESGIWKIV